MKHRSKRSPTVKPQARFFSKNRGFALLVRKGNPLEIRGLTDVVRTGARVALPDAGEEAGSRARTRTVLENLLGKSEADAFFAAEVPNFPGRIGIVHRDFPEMVARDYADVALTQYHLISYWTRIFPSHFELVPVSGGERFFINIAFARVVDALRPRALKAFDEFFFSRARDVYPRYDFVSMNDAEFGATVSLD
jgi:accessory colonization factor AcfC